VNDYLSLSATINTGAGYQSISWSSNNTSVATVSYNGLNASVTGKAGGTATITVTVTNYDGSKKTATCTVTVKVIAVTGVSLSLSTLTLEVGQTDYLSASVSPNNATNQNVSWSSNNTSVATVSYNGLNASVTGKAAGTATITVKTADGNITATCAVTVKPVTVTGVTITTPVTSLLRGKTGTAKASVQPSAASQSVTWSTSNTSVATVSSSGVVTAVAGGSATITATSVADSTKSASFNVSVTPELTSLSLSPTNLVAPYVSGTVILFGNAPFTIVSVTKISAERPVDPKDENGEWESFSGTGLDFYFETPTATTATTISIGQTGIPTKMRATYKVTVKDNNYGTIVTVQGTYYCW
jgi:uncharacterized protein YjdB